MSLPASRSRPAASSRGQRAEKAIIDAVLDLLDQEDASGLTIDKIANRAQVGKPTIYPRWSTKSELVAYAFGNLADPLPSGPQANLRDMLVTALTEFHARLTDTRHGRAWRRIRGSQGEYADASTATNASTPVGRPPPQPCKHTSMRARYETTSTPTH
ncbi:TetR family transcriptional regulator [Rhodococcus hoagii]|nr:TetR family transcriptional regulator [Prescottella equi]